MVSTPPVPVSTSLLGEAWVERVWLRSAAPMSGRLPAGCGRAWPSWSVGKAASGSPPLSAGLVMLLRSGMIPSGIERATAGVRVDGGEQQAGRNALPVADDRARDVAAEDVVAVAGRHCAIDVVSLVVTSIGAISSDNAISDGNVVMGGDPTAVAVTRIIAGNCAAAQRHRIAIDPASIADY